MTIALASTLDVLDMPVDFDASDIDLDWHKARDNTHTAQVRALQAALIAGEQSGKPTPIDFATFKARMRADHERAHAH